MTTLADLIRIQGETEAAEQAKRAAEQAEREAERREAERAAIARLEELIGPMVLDGITAHQPTDQERWDGHWTGAYPDLVLVVAGFSAYLRFGGTEQFQVTDTPLSWQRPWLGGSQLTREERAREFVTHLAGCIVPRVRLAAPATSPEDAA